MKKFRLLLLSLAFVTFATSMADAHDCGDTFAGTWHFCTNADIEAIIYAVAERCGQGGYDFEWIQLPPSVCSPIPE